LREDRLTLIEACDKAADIISHSRHLDKLYRKAVGSLGEGELRNNILTMVTDAIQDERLRDEVLVSNDNMLGFMCGVWIQFLLLEIGEVKKDNLQKLAQKAFMTLQRNTSIH